MSDITRARPGPAAMLRSAGAEDHARGAAGRSAARLARARRRGDARTAEPRLVDGHDRREAVVPRRRWLPGLRPRRRQGRDAHLLRPLLLGGMAGAPARRRRGDRRPDLHPRLSRGDLPGRAGGRGSAGASVRDRGQQGGPRAAPGRAAAARPLRPLVRRRPVRRRSRSAGEAPLETISVGVDLDRRDEAFELLDWSRDRRPELSGAVTTPRPARPV